jgi:stage II sporulation protein D
MQRGRYWSTIGALVVAGALAQGAVATPEPDEEFVPEPPAATAGHPVRVRMVGRLGGATSLAVRPERACRLVNVATGAVLAEIPGGETWEVTLHGSGVRAAQAAGSASVEGATLRFESDPDAALSVQSGRARSARGTPLLLPGALEVARARRGLGVVNTAPLESYIVGVVAAEGPASFHPEALKALAIAARSYTECNRGRHGDGTDLCDTTHCHAYAGIGRAAASVRAAVTATAGIVALYGGRPIDAVYSADCGGRTQTPDDAWGSRRRPIPYLRSVLDAPAEGETPYCAVNPRRGWQISLPLTTLRRRLGWGAEVPFLWEAAVGATNPSGRATRIRLRGGALPRPTEGEPEPEGGSGKDTIDPHSAKLLQSPGEATSPAAPSVTRELTLAQFRDLIRPHALPGRFFHLTLGKEELRIEGAGLGHGVGLCQYGAHGMALRGHSCEAILKHYYAEIELGPLPPGSAGVPPASGRREDAGETPALPGKTGG